MRTRYQLGAGRYIETERTPTPLEEWQEEAVSLFGKNARDWKFRCPMCGKTYTVQEFVEAGGDVNGAYVKCIGRYKGAGSPGSKDGNPNGCNWTAYGFLGIPNDNGRLVLVPDGTVAHIFDFAREEVAE